MEVIPGVYPNGGYKFVDSEGTPFESDSLVNLVQSVWSYRRRLKRPMGNPYKEVCDYICAQQPGICHDNGGEKNITNAISSHAIELLKERDAGTLELTNSDIVELRVKICQGCPLKLNYVSSCVACQENLDAILSASISPKPPAKELSGCFCQRGEDELSIAVWVHNGRVFKQGAPASCWRAI
jgi:hypothetical protein